MKRKNIYVFAKANELCQKDKALIHKSLAENIQNWHKRCISNGQGCCKAAEKKLQGGLSWLTKNLLALVLTMVTVNTIPVPAGNLPIVPPLPKKLAIPFPKGIMSITKMVLKPITALPTWQLSRLPFIVKFTRKQIHLGEIRLPAFS